MTKEVKTQWHPAFCSAMKLELIANKADLDYTNEYNLNSKPIQIDLLVIKKSKGAVIHNEIGKIFRGHNIMEYKSPRDDMNVDTFIKVIAYACLYKVSEKHADEISLEDITITLVREGKPRELLKWFVRNSYKVIEKYHGIYYVEKEGCFPIQVIVSGKLSPENQKWLTLLSSSLQRQDAERIIIQTENLTQKDEKLYADSVLQVALSENKEMFNRMRGENADMCEALRELMKEDLEAARASGEEAGKEIGTKIGTEIGKEIGKKIGIEIGKENGEKIGREQARKELIINSFKNNRTAEEIADFLSIPLEEVKEAEALLKNE